MSSPLFIPNILCNLLVVLTFAVFCTPDGVPRIRVPYETVARFGCALQSVGINLDGNFKIFREEGVWNYSSMLMREDLGLLILGAREAIYALDVNDISIAKANVSWQVTQAKRNECTYKGKNPDIECRNYIRTLHQISDGVMYVCGTNAFNPICDNIAYVDGQLKLEGKQEEGKGKCPFDPFQRYSSIVVDGDLYSATALNFLGSEPVILRSSQNFLRTEFKSSWLNEPNFIYMDVVPESENSPEGDDDKIYIFFSENAVEYDFYNKLVVSRVAQVCKGDRGGQRTLQRKWTSFLKASLNCPVPGDILPYVVQDVFQIQHKDWRKRVFYAIFTSQSTSNDVSSAVCAFAVSDINEVFSRGRYKTPVTVEASHVKWVMYTGDIPFPRPGACINNAVRASGIQSSLDLPDKTLQFIRDRPLMDDSVKPLTGRPLLTRKGVSFTRLVVDHMTALDGQSYLVMFIGTDNGFVQKAVNYDGEMHIIEELQLYKSPEPVTVLRLSISKGQLYAGSAFGVVQMPLADCGRYTSCLDCVLARDPYCVWNLTSQYCTTLPSPSKDIYLVQSLKEGNASRCPDAVPVTTKNRTLVLGNNIKLPCQSDSSLAQVNWQFAGQPLNPSKRKYGTFSDCLLIYNASIADAGRYTCESVERVVSTQYRRTLAIYELYLTSADDDLTTKKPHTVSTTVSSAVPLVTPARQSTEKAWLIMQLALGMLAVTLLTLCVWNVWMGHLPLPRCCRQQIWMSSQRASAAYIPQFTASESTEPLTGQSVIAINNDRNGTNKNTLKHTIDESEI